MLKKRIIPTILFNGHSAVKPVAFGKDQRPLGPLMQTVRVYNRRNVDELILIDIGATPNNHDPDYELIRSIAKDCMMPLTVGGGVKTLEQMRELFNNGADKIVVKSLFKENPNLVEEAANKFGAQAIVLALDLEDSSEFPSRIPNVGEIILTSIPQDGTMGGYDLKLITLANDYYEVPVIANGGAGTYEHLHEAFLAGADAVAACSMFQYTEQTPKGAAEYLAEKGIPVRLAA